MINHDKYKVVIREKATGKILQESVVITGYDSWITACIQRDFIWDEYRGDKTVAEIKIEDA